MTILRSAYFQVCSNPRCHGCHGRIVLSDGSDSGDIYIRTEAAGQVMMLLEDGIITNEEAIVLRGQIESSNLYPDGCSIPPVVRAALTAVRNALVVEITASSADEDDEESGDEKTFLKPDSATLH